jgi:hypothetical protein
VLERLETIEKLGFTDWPPLAEVRAPTKISIALRL